MPTLNWVTAAINITFAVMIFWLLLPPYNRRIRWVERIPYAALSSYSAITAAFQIGAWTPREWNDSLLILNTSIAASYIVVILYLRLRCWRQRKRCATRVTPDDIP